MDDSLPGAEYWKEAGSNSVLRSLFTPRLSIFGIIPPSISLRPREPREERTKRRCRKKSRRNERDLIWGADALLSPGCALFSPAIIALGVGAIALWGGAWALRDAMG